MNRRETCQVCAREGVTLRKTCESPTNRDKCHGQKVCLGCSRKWKRSKPARTSCCGVPLDRNTQQQQFTMALRSGSAGAMSRADMEADAENVAASRAALVAMSSMCPQCGVSYEKREGCNAMECEKCHLRFKHTCGCPIAWFDDTTPCFFSSMVNFVSYPILDPRAHDPRMHSGLAAIGLLATGLSINDVPTHVKIDHFLNSLGDAPLCTEPIDRKTNSKFKNKVVSPRTHQLIMWRWMNAMNSWSFGSDCFSEHAREAFPVDTALYMADRVNYDEHRRQYDEIHAGKCYAPMLRSIVSVMDHCVETGLLTEDHLAAFDLRPRLAKLIAEGEARERACHSVRMRISRERRAARRRARKVKAATQSMSGRGAKRRT